jgi:ubiquinone/menaquinone biosynthesis C-methylase UbiE
MMDSTNTNRQPGITVSEWRRIHNGAASGYKAGEWFRESLLSVKARRKKLFSQASGNVLDVACGYGLNFDHLGSASSISAVEFSPVMLAMAREHARSLGLHVNLSEGNAEALDFPDHSFDTVISSLATCSFQNPIAALREMQRVCKPDGRILLLEHGRSNREWLGSYQDRHAASEIAHSGCHWNQEPQELARAAGLKIVEVERTFLGVLHAIKARPGK